jgi:hypothetical protein
MKHLLSIGRPLRMALNWVMPLGSVCFASAQPESPTHSSVRVAGIILKWVRGDKEANWRRLEPMVREAAKSGARIVVTTECFLDG